MKAEARRKPALLDQLGAFIDRTLKGDGKKSAAKKFSYLKAFWADFGVASVTPSSKFVVQRVIRAMDLRKARVVLEYGAAEGVITREILAKLPADGKLVALELNGKLFEALKSIRDPRLIAVNGDVRHIDRVLTQAGITEVDAVTSGIPFAFLKPRERDELLRRTAQCLRPGGRFVPYQVTTHLIGLLEKYFSKVKTEFEIRNLPPHFIFTAFK